MKISSIVLLLAIIGASLQQTAPAPSCSRTDTANNNRFALKWLEDKKVTIHSTPQTFTDTTVCGGNWAHAKTCCDLTSLKEHIRAQNEQVITRWKNYIGKLSRVR